MEQSLPFAFSIETAAFLIVDLQNDFVRQGAPLEVPDARKTLAPVNEIAALFRRHGRPVVFTRFVAGPEPSLLWNWSPQLREPVNCCRIGHRRRYEDIGAERECIAVVDELAPQPGDITVDKYWYGAFFRTNLEDVLHSFKVDSVVIAGTVTQICVEDSARQAFQHGFKLIVLRDCVSSFDPQLHEATLKNLHLKFGVVMSSAELVRLVS
jgi:nicotinamidase-related amidase